MNRKSMRENRSDACTSRLTFWVTASDYRTEPQPKHGCVNVHVRGAMLQTQRKHRCTSKRQKTRTTRKHGRSPWRTPNSVSPETYDNEVDDTYPGEAHPQSLPPHFLTLVSLTLAYRPLLPSLSRSSPYLPRLSFRSMAAFVSESGGLLSACVDV